MAVYYAAQKGRSSILRISAAIMQYKIAGHMFLHNISGADKIFYTTGRLTSEMVIKTVLMGILFWCRDPALPGKGRACRQAGLTLVGRMRGTLYCFVRAERVIFDHLDTRRKRKKNPLPNAPLRPETIAR